MTSRETARTVEPSTHADRSREELAPAERLATLRLELERYHTHTLPAGNGAPSRAQR